MKYLLLFALLALPLLLGGCYTPLVEGAQEGYDAARRDPLHKDAVAGDAVAQYKLGDTYCCQGGGPLNNATIYDNHKATYWYCRSARQNYGPAQLRLAQVYSGHPIHGLHVALRASALAGTVETDSAVALMWASVAATHGDEDAVELRDQIAAKATGVQRARAAALMNDWRTAPCHWADVISASTSARK